MINLASTSSKLQVVTSSAATVDANTNWIDYDSSGGYVPAQKNTAISSATTTDIVTAPASSHVNNVKSVHLRNRDASLSCDVTLQHTDGSVVVQLAKATLAVGETLYYSEETGPILFDSSGQQKVVAPATTNLVLKALASDHSNATTTATEVSGLTQNVGVGTWLFEYFVIYRSDTTTTGIKFSVNHTGTVTFFVYDAMYVDNSATASTGAADQDALATTAQVMGAYAARAKSTSGTMITASVDCRQNGGWGDSGLFRAAAHHRGDFEDARFRYVERRRPAGYERREHGGHPPGRDQRGVR